MIFGSGDHRMSIYISGTRRGIGGGYGEGCNM